MTVLQRHGAPICLSARQVEEHGFALHKGTFRGCVALCYGWESAQLPSRCVCGEDFNTSHALSCPTGGFQIVWHNEVRDPTAGLLREVCHDIEIEPRLQPLTGEQLRPSVNDNPKAQLNIKVSGEDGLNTHFLTYGSSIPARILTALPRWHPPTVATSL